MPDGTTTNLSMTKPEVGASADTWGTKLNTNFDTLDAIFGASGTAVSMGAITAASLTVSGAATFNGAVTLGNAAGDTLTATGTWSNLGSATTVDINGGTVDGAIIGGSSAAAGSFTTLAASSTITLTGTQGYRVNPGSDTNTPVMQVIVTGTPSISWDETNDWFNITHGLNISGDTVIVGASGASVGFFGSTVTKQTVSGSRGGNAALASLLTALDNCGLIDDTTT
jgi:hypothetical protein